MVDTMMDPARKPNVYSAVIILYIRRRAEMLKVFFLTILIEYHDIAAIASVAERAFLMPA